MGASCYRRLNLTILRHCSGVKQTTPDDLTSQRPLAHDQGDDEQGYNIDDFNHRIDRRSSGILVRIADRITGDGSLVRLASLLPLLFDVLLRIVPGAAAARHGDGHEEPGDDAADQYATQRLRSEADPDEPRRQPGNPA